MRQIVTPISRRTMLRGLGAMIALPCLELMGGKSIAAAAGQSEPSRLAWFYIPGAINHYNWFPVDEGLNYTIAPTHQPLAPHRDQFSVLTNLLHIQGRISGHEHPYNWLTGTNIKATPGTITNSISMDQVAAKHIGNTYVPSLALSFENGVGTRTLSRNDSGADIPAVADYRKVFERLFPPADRNQIKDAQARLALDRSVLDTAIGEVGDLRRKLGHADQHRLEQYLEIGPGSRAPPRRKRPDPSSAAGQHSTSTACASSHHQLDVLAHPVLALRRT